MITREKYQLLSDWARVSIIHISPVEKAILAGSIAGLVLAETPDNDAIFAMPPEQRITLFAKQVDQYCGDIVKHLQL